MGLFAQQGRGAAGGKASSSRPTVAERLEGRQLLDATVSGLTATYYDNVDFTGSAVTRVEPVVNFFWGLSSPAPAIQPDTFSARWTGTVRAPETGKYTFTATSDDGVRVWVGGQLLVNAWFDQAGDEHSGSIHLAAGEVYDVKVEYFENGGGANMRLMWATPSAPTTKHVVPGHVLFSPAAGNAAVRTHNGLRGEYFLDKSLTTLLLDRVDPAVNFAWGLETPAGGIPDNSFSARWTGQVTAPETGAFTFHTVSDDGIRLWVDGKLLVDQWNNHAPTEHTGQIVLQAGRMYDVKLEYYESGGAATARLLWTKPSGEKSVIPHANLSTALPVKSFQLFDATAYTDKPGGVLPGTTRIHVVNNAELWPQGADLSRLPSVVRVRALAQRHPNEFVVFDIEHWPLNTIWYGATQEAYDETLQRFTWLATEVKKASPTTKVGFYGLPPEFGGALNYGPEIVERDTRRIAESGLLNVIDALFPTLYVRYENSPTSWTARGQQTLRLAKTLGKPVYPFIWPQYHDASKWAWQHIDGTFWSHILATMKAEADGAVIWGGTQLVKGRWTVMPFEPTEEWWQSTEDFVPTLTP